MKSQFHVIGFDDAPFRPEHRGDVSVVGAVSNSGLASSLTSYYVNYGDWRMLFKSIDVIGAVTADDVQRVVKTYFIQKHRTVAYHVKPAPEAPAGKEKAE